MEPIGTNFAATAPVGLTLESGGGLDYSRTS